jgi:tRNA G18 (ribose-2'-O)-methylase SpoU
VDDRALKKIETMPSERLVSILYALTKSWEQVWPEAFDELDRLEAFVNELNKRDAAKYSRFLNYASKVNRLQDIISLSVFLEREQKLNIKENDFLDSNPHKKDGLSKENLKIDLFFILDDIRSAFNVGSVFRLAECIGVKKIYLCGYTATPENAKIEKSAMGTESLVEWEYVPNKAELFRKLRSEGVRLVALETLNDSQSYHEYKVQDQKIALWAGNERFGIDVDDLSFADQVLHIPLYGNKNSLNVAQALSVVGFHVSNQLRG